MNVLRGYRHDDVAPFDQHVWEGLEEGRPALGEGSCDPNGAMGGVHVMRRRGRGLEREALFLFTDFSREGISPMQFRDWLPRDLRRPTSRHADGGHPLISFLSLWQSAWHTLRKEGGLREPNVLFAASLERIRPSLVGAHAVDFEIASYGGYVCVSPGFEGTY